MFVSSFFFLVGSAAAFVIPTTTVPHRAAAGRTCELKSSSTDYLSTLSSGLTLSSSSWTAPPSSVTAATPPDVDEAATTFSHAPISYFDVNKLTSKGPRKNPDVGQPHDATRPLVTVGPASAGSWWCAEGGWPSPAQRATTEVFYVFSGRGCVTDLDGTRHEFGAGDTVILPKGWSGRWDIMQAIHKVWAVYDHPNIEETSNPIRAVITPSGGLASHQLTPDGVRPDAIYGSPATASRTIYNVGPTQVGAWSCTPGSFPVFNKPKTEFFHVLEGVFFLTNADGSARRCGPGDTVVLPKGWTGHWDVIETVRKLWVVVD